MLPKTPKNRRMLWLTAVTLLIAMGALQALFYFATQREALSEAKDSVANILHIQRALRSYVEDVVRPEVYLLQEREILDADYFSPEIMSRSFVSRQTLKIFDQQKAPGSPELIFRYVSTSPLNMNNAATADELELYRLFSQQEITQFQQVVKRSGRNYLYYALPLDRFQLACLHCHGNPEDAPLSLTERYGKTHGFNRQAGELSGMTTITLDLTYYEEKSWRLFLFVSALTFSVFFSVFTFFWYLVFKKDQQDQLLLSKNIELDRLSSIDALTGVWNRLQFNREIKRAMAQATMLQASLALILLDLDFFKRVNDTYGHSVGDEVLKIFAAFLNKTCRRSDFVARYGGEEFIIIVPGVDEKELVAYAERLLGLMSAVEYPFDLHLTASLGLAIMQPGEDADRFFCRVDRALYVSKKEGRFRYTLASDECISR
jgi:diguanylate cyclase (GGDEF)-like protein